MRPKLWSETIEAASTGDVRYALAAAGGLPSKAAVRRLVMLILAGRQPRG